MMEVVYSSNTCEQSKKEKRCKNPKYDYHFIKFKFNLYTVYHMYVTDYEQQNLQFSIHFTETEHLKAQSLNPTHIKR